MRIKMAEYGASKPYENCFMRATERIYSGEPLVLWSYRIMFWEMETSF